MSKKEEENKEKIKVAVLGFGGRGKNYARLCKNNSASFEIVAIIDNSEDKINVAKELFSNAKCYNSLTDFLKEPKMADYLFVCTQDKDHREHAIAGLEHGYDLLLEKPIACSIEDCLAIEHKALELGRKVAVCHVLRYSSYYRNIKSVLDSGVLGKIIAIEQVENVAYWHQAHSYVRGDWRREDESNPMILAKCCHDLDIAVYLAGSKCVKVNSCGKLNYFKRENAPKGATEYCMGGCAAKENCPYDAEKIYIDKIKGLPPVVIKNMWPQARLMDDGEVTIPKLREAIKTTRYGKCVFMSDNDVVDYQTTVMEFENGITSTLTMTAFSNKCYRETRIRGVNGDLRCNLGTNKIELEIFGKKAKKMKFGHLLDAHGGGDSGLIKDLATGEIKTDISASIESHIIGFAAEMSRKNDGKAVNISELRNSVAKK